MKKFLSAVLVAILIFSFTACGSSVDKAGLWENAMYLEDTVLGNGEKTFTAEVEAGEEVVVFTVNTDKKTVGEALTELMLVDGEEGPYGLYVKAVNGITADYDVDKSYWAFYIGEEYATSGMDTTEITEGATYRIVYTK